MQFYNNTLCISFRELVNTEVQPNVIGQDAFISRYDYINLSKNKKLVTVRRGSRNTPALYNFDLLPMDIRQAVSAKYKDLIRTAQQEPVKQALQMDYKALSFFTNYILPDGSHLKENLIREYAATATAINMMISLQSDSRAWRRALGGSPHQKGAFKNLLDYMASLQQTWGWKLPSTERGVKGKISKYNLMGYSSLISGKLCNENAAKLVETTQEAALRRLMAVGRNFDDMQVARIYNLTAAAAGWKKISRKTVANKRSDWQIYTDAGSRGKVNHDNTHAMQVKRRAPSAPLLYWTLDGWDIELLYQSNAINSKGHRVTTYHNRLTMVVVLDPCGKYPIGYAIGSHETPALIRSAIRNAVLHTEELFGALHQVHQLQTDRYGIANLSPFYEAVSAIYTPAAVKNAKSKVIEPYFKYLNKTYCQFQPNWSGFGLTAKKEQQPNSEYLNKIRHQFPDQKGCIEQITNMMNAERKSKVADYVKAYDHLDETQKLTITKAEFLYRLGEHSGKTNRLTGSGIHLEVNRQKYVYDTYDPAFRKHRNEQWILRYDPTDMSKVLASSIDGALRFMLTEKFEQPMALAERKAGDAAELQKVFRYNEALVKDILDTQSNDFEQLEALYHRVPAIQETLGKLLIVDSKGQHKDHKNEQRLINSSIKTQPSLENAPTKQAKKEQQLKREAYLDSRLDLHNFLNNSSI